MTHLLDTTALLALVLDEGGAEAVQNLLNEEQAGVAVSVLTKAEVWSRLKSLGRDAVFEEEWKALLPLFDAVLSVDPHVVDQSIALRRATPDRLPTTDSLIAATAAVHSLVLVHRDAHFQSIPADRLTCLDLTTSPAA
jgi:predicted nucleic acid-binding protein